MTEPVTEPARVPSFEPIDFTVTEADSIRRQGSDAEGWYWSLPFNPRP